MNNGDNLLEQNEKVQITVLLTAIDNPALGADTEFTIEFKTPQGLPLNIQKRMPVHLDPVMVLN